MKHYFLESEHDSKDYFVITSDIGEKQYSFWSCDNVFSKDCVDYGTLVLLNTILKTQKLDGKVLDIGCGYEVIGIVLANNFKNINVCMTDVNPTAIELSKRNIALNNIKNVSCVKESFAYQNVPEIFDWIISNPPIKAGKKVLLDILLGAFEHLNDGGNLIFVIKKKFGEDSIKKQLQRVFKSVEILKRDSGYYVLIATK